MKRLLVVIDMQNEFVTGVYGSYEARAIVSGIINKINSYTISGDDVVYTQDTHSIDYYSSGGGNRSSSHRCSDNEWEFVKGLPVKKDAIIFEKHTYASLDLANYINNKNYDEVELCGVCTEVCVIANAILIRTICPKVKIIVASSTTAGLTKERSNNALSLMDGLYIKIIK